MVSSPIKPKNMRKCHSPARSVVSQLTVDHSCGIIALSTQGSEKIWALSVLNVNRKLAGTETTEVKSLRILHCKFGCISIIYDFIFLYSWSLFKEHVNEVHPDSKNKELVKLHIYAGFETSPKHKVQGKIGIVVIVFITFKYNIHVVLSMMKKYMF